MASFCNRCHKEMGFPGEPDIDVQATFDKLEEGYYQSVGLCEGCTLMAVSKIEGKLKVQYLDGGWVDYTRGLQKGTDNE